MKSNMSISVEFLAGTSLKDAVTEAKSKAEKFDAAYICFDFNGVQFSIGRNADVSNVLAEYDSERNGLGMELGICSN